MYAPPIMYKGQLFNMEQAKVTSMFLSMKGTMNTVFEFC